MKTILSCASISREKQSDRIFARTQDKKSSGRWQDAQLTCLINRIEKAILNLTHDPKCYMYSNQFLNAWLNCNKNSFPAL